MAGKVLLVGLPTDGTFRHTVARAAALHMDFDTLDLEAFYAEGRLFVDLDHLETATLVMPNTVFQLGQYASCYQRIIDVSINEDSPKEQQMIRGKCLALLTYFDLCAGMVVNRPWAGGSNSAKPYHIRRLKAVGFDVPPSLSTNDPREARAFLEQWSGRVVYKSNGTARSIVHLVEGVDLERLHLIEGCPVLFQRYIAGSDVRVHVVGDQIFAEEIISPCVDYRHAEGNASKPHVLPEAIAQKCVTATRMEGLIFAGIDFKICAEDGKYYALEVNPMPGYDGYDRRLGCVISSALISLLQGHT